MKALIFAAGLGSRLKPLTDTMPKALVPVGGKPLLEWLILRLKKAGFDEFVVNVHHFSQQIKDFLAKNNNFGVKINVSDESDFLLETGGGILFAEKFLASNEPFLVHNVDILSNLDEAKFYAEAIKKDSLATLLVNNRVSSRYLLFQEGALRGWLNEKTGETKPLENMKVIDFEKFAFSGIHVVSPKIFDVMHQKQCEGKFSIIDFYLSVCNEQKITMLHSSDLQLIDVGKLDTLQHAEEFLKNRN